MHLLSERQYNEAQNSEFKVSFGKHSCESYSLPIYAGIIGSKCTH